MAVHLRQARLAICAAVALLAVCGPAAALTTISGYVLDPNWYAPHPKMTSPQVYGTGLYEYGVSGNISSSTLTGLYSSTENYGDNYGWGVFGFFRKTNQNEGVYTLASWDVWHRSSYLFNVSFSGTSPPVQIIRLHANMWCYAPNWSNPYNEIGQVFEATGSSLTLITVRSPLAGIGVTVTIHDGGPDGPQIGPSRHFTTPSGPSDTRIFYSGGEVPTVPGHLYYIKFKADGASQAMFCYEDPVPDLSDPMPGGSVYHEHVQADPRTDLGLILCSDDDGILTNLNVQAGGYAVAGTSVGQTFIARGVNLLSYSAWVYDSSITYVATLYDAVGGTKIGTAKKGQTMRWASPEVLWTWAPGECPLTPGQTYYLEITRNGGGNITVDGCQWAFYANGQAYANRTSQPWYVDLIGVIMEEESAGSATKPTVQFATFPSVSFTDRATTTLALRWNTDVASDTTVQYAPWSCPYTKSYYNSTLVTSHVAVLSDLQPNTMYHLRVKCAASAHRTGVTRDFVTCTKNDLPNLLVNPGFEDGSGSSPRKPLAGWSASGGIDNGASDGTWFWGIPPYADSWLWEGAMNGFPCTGDLYQRVPAIPGVEYRFTAAMTSWMRENDTWKYDMWTDSGRMDYLKIGIDPTGGTDPNSAHVQWVPRFYSHRHYTVVGTKAVAQGDYITAFIEVKGDGGQWHVYGVDDCRLCATYSTVQLDDLKKNKPDGYPAEVANLIVTATPSEAGAYYVETADRTQGIRVQSSDTVAVGNNVTVRGALYIDPQTGERSLASANLVGPVMSIEPKPMEMLCKNVGGVAYGNVPGVPGSVGLHNTGLVVRVAGTITAKDPAGAYVFVNDGSMGGDGMRIDTSRVAPAAVPAVGEVVSIAGVSSRYFSGSIKPLLIVRRASDVSSAYN